ncbi:hypothetical protein [Phenylobacterium sp.]|uniref:hypothetical protein n=1 Tax=Phenylobacterium sp. TaxID=1871053 RepID=UPI0025DC2044|nr:hypothetical protein [Phenylobacterium sp.]MBX3482549.1 hypothetical protein [Phenylobacterium sp.]MCW5758757.1 hypothetical protein [Phenylobacterium sp.]
MTDIVAPPPINTLPPAPVRGQPGFSNATGTFLEALPDWGDDVDASGAASHQNAVAAQERAALAQAAAVDAQAARDLAVNTTGFLAFSSSSVAVGTGLKTFHLELIGGDPPDFGGQDFLCAFSRSTPDARVYGNIDAWDGVDDITLDVPARGVSGSGTYDDWVIVLGGFFESGATAEEIRAGTSDFVAVSPKGLADTVAFGTLADASTIAWDTIADGPHVRVTLTANGHAVGAPTGLGDGLTYVININPATYTCSWNAIWDFGQVGPPSFPASAWSKVTAQYDAALNKLQAGVWRGA